MRTTIPALALGLFVAGSAAADDTSKGNAAVADADDSKISEIVVTAQKRKERLQDVPISISVLTGAQLDRSTVDGVREALNSVPGVSISTNQNSSPMITMRGVSASSARFTGTGVAAFYLDSVPVGLARSAIVPDTGAYDLDRIEVLRGPQGTLYGASALNGVIRILTKDPELDRFEFKARGLTSSTEDGGFNYRGDMAVNAPLIDGRLAVRAVAGYENMSGWIDRVIRKDSNDLKTSNLRLKMLAKPVDDLSIGLSAWRSRIDAGSQSIGDANNRNPALVNEPSSDNFDTYRFNVLYELPAFSVSSTTGYMDADISSLTDFAPFGIPVVTGTQIAAHVLSEELLLSSTGEGPWRWSIGGMYRDEKDTTQQAFTSSPALVTDFTDTSESFAAFGEITRVLMDGKFELTGGLRYFEDKVSITNRTARAAGVTFDSVDGNTFEQVSPRAVIKWIPNSDLNIYASYAEGYRSGTNQNPPAFLFPASKPDTLKNYEMGTKGNLLGGKVGFDLAVYYMDWVSFQAARTITGIFGGQSISTSAMINGESASGMGVDVGVTVRPTDGLRLYASASWNDLTLDKDVFNGTTRLAVKGDRLNNSPRMSYSASAEYSFPMGRQGLEGAIETSANYDSEQKISLNALVSSDTLLIGRAAFTVRSPAHWTGSLFIDNITNENGVAVNLNLPAAPYYTVRNRPRTLGLQLEYKY